MHAERGLSFFDKSGRVRSIRVLCPFGDLLMVFATLYALY